MHGEGGGREQGDEEIREIRVLYILWLGDNKVLKYRVVILKLSTNYTSLFQ